MFDMTLRSKLTVEFDHLFSPSPEELLNCDREFLQSLHGPTVIHIEGDDPTRTRVLTTLIHGNEPSGFKAVHRLLSEQCRPATNVKIVMPNVRGAQVSPLFSQRYLKNKIDLNRCFKPPYDNECGLLAKATIDQIHAFSPEAIVDLHNTSSISPAFALATRTETKFRQLASIFTPYLVHTGMQLGTLMEVPFLAPIVTIEAGCGQDHDAHEAAYDGMAKFFTLDNLFTEHQPVTLLEDARRLELRRNAVVAFSDKPVFGINVTMDQAIDRRNFAITEAGSILGWVDHNQLDHFKLGGSGRREKTTAYFSATDHAIRNIKPMRIFMSTTIAEMAKQDCLFYFVEVDEKAT